MPKLRFSADRNTLARRAAWAGAAALAITFLIWWFRPTQEDEYDPYAKPFGDQ